MDNSTILAWIFTTLLLIVGVMLYRNTHSHDKKSVSGDFSGVRRKVLVVANDILFSQSGTECDVYQQNIAILVALIKKYDVYVAVCVADEKEGETIRMSLFDAGLSSIQSGFYREKILLFTEQSSLVTIASILGIEVIITDKPDVESLFDENTMQIVRQTADSFSKEF